MKRSHVGLAVLVLWAGVPRVEAAAPSAHDLVESLRDDDEVTARAAQQMLVAMGPEAVRPLQRVLFDADYRLRLRATEVLATLGPQAKHVAPDLVLVLGDPQPAVHDAAHRALVAMGDDAVPPLLDALKSKNESLRKLALGTLSACGPKGIPDILRVLKKDESPLIRTAAAEALGEVKNPGPEVISGLVGAFGDLEESVRGTAADSLGQLGPAAKAAIGPLIVMSHDDRDALTRKRASDALVHIGSAGPESVSGFIASLHSPNEEVRRQVIGAISGSTIPWQDAMPVISSALKDASPAVRLQAVQATVIYSSGTATLPILRQALADSNVDVRAAAIEVTGHLKDASTEAAKEIQKFVTDPNPVIRQDTIRALSRLGPAGIPGLIQALSDSYSALSDEAAKGIVQMGQEAVPALQAMEQSPDPNMKRKAAQLLQRINQGSETPAPPKAHRKPAKSS